MNNNSFQNQIEQYKKQEAKNKMGTTGVGVTGTGMTSTVPGNNVTSQAQLKNSEKLKAKEEINTMY